MSFVAKLNSAIQEAATRAEGSTRAERVMLRIGALASALLLASALFPLVKSDAPNYAPTLTELLSSLKRMDARGRLHLGLLLLCLSPLFRLFVLAVIHGRRRSWDLVLTVAIVMAAVGLSFFLGLH